MPPSLLVLHYAEIALKGENRGWFEGRLKDNLQDALRAAGAPGSVRRERGRIVVALADPSPAALEAACGAVSRTPGVAWFAAAEEAPRDIGAIEALVVARARASAGSFAVDTRRADKTFPLTSMEVNRRVGAAVVAATGRPVDLGSPAETLGIEIAADRAFVLGPRRAGPGGLPVGSSGRVVALLSGGIDSPVAAWRMMRRGCRVLAVHFFNGAAGGEGVLEKLDLLGEALARWQGRLNLRVVPFEAIQRAIVAAVPADHRMIVYRRTMLRLADRIRESENARALVTGDSVGQVASQTLENLACAYAAVPGPVLAPLSGAEKEEIIADARRVGTFEASCLPHQDCCSFLISPHPATKARLREVEEMEAAVAWGTLLEEALAAAPLRSYPAGG
ncbi:MAG: tRNA 4-thiouridine(8) synthase ThiI [Planctomycetes bacterium]|nr:tRNA 4-thiouridine(8) synthase ThiI [Planctomycetota bacterium]